MEVFNDMSIGGAIAIASIAISCAVALYALFKSLGGGFEKD